MKKTVASALSLAIALGGCATASKDVATAYVSPIQFSNYTCDQIIAESARIQVRVNQLEGRLDTAATNDKVLTGVALVLFWPAVFALGGTKEQEAEYGRLKGEHEALKQAWIQKSCVAAVGSGSASAGMPTTPTSPGTSVTAVPVAGANPQITQQATSLTSLGVGDRLTYTLRETTSGVSQGETKVVISSISNGQIGFDDDSLVMSAQGAVSKGNVTRPTVLGIDVARLQTGNKFQGKYRIVAARVQDVPVDLIVTGTDVVELSGRRISAVRLDASGYSSREILQGGLGAGAPFSGTLLIEPSTGIVISMKIKSQNSMYAFDWTLVGISNSGIPPASTGNPQQALPSIAPVAQQSTASAQPQSKEERLKELKRLFDAGLLSQDVYTAQQRAILLGN